MFLEKIYVFLWFWHFLVGIITLISFVTWFLRMGFSQRRVQFVRKYLKIMSVMRETDKAATRRFVEHYLRPDGVFLLHLIAINVGDLMAGDLACELWHIYRHKRLQDMEEEAKFHLEAAAAAAAVASTTTGPSSGGNISPIGRLTASSPPAPPPPSQQSLQLPPTSAGLGLGPCLGGEFNLADSSAGLSLLGNGLSSTAPGVIGTAGLPGTRGTGGAGLGNVLTDPTGVGGGGNAGSSDKGLSVSGASCLQVGLSGLNHNNGINGSNNNDDSIV
ncbi:unnamed protein product [Protopolystoma xenopodis]|uniref:Innexin n=1 Tax=Protopolystoma xenopodis TaxID=117903 RepID=A0A448WDM5_9PLAT|nr:unnamed protein product [Protopolystoma xenopodis]